MNMHRLAREADIQAERSACRQSAGGETDRQSDRQGEIDFRFQLYQVQYRLLSRSVQNGICKNSIPTMCVSSSVSFAMP